MNILKAAKYGLIACAGFAAAPVNAAIIQDDVTFTTTWISSTQFSLTITGMDAATGGWTGASSITALAIKNIGAFTNATVPGGVFDPDELNAQGCAGGESTNQACFAFSPGVEVSPSMVFTFTFTGANIASDGAPHVKINVACDDDETKKCGSLLSLNVPFEGGDDDDDDDDDTDLPEPGSLALLGLGLLGLGLGRRRK